MSQFTKIEKKQINPDEPPHAEAAFVETTGEWDEFLFLTQGDESEERYIVLSPQEFRELVKVGIHWLRQDDAQRRENGSR